MPTIVDLASLGSGGFVLTGDRPDQYAGLSVSDAGDVNGDGFGDVIVGSADDAAYVVFGGAGGFGSVDLGNLGANDGFLIRTDPGEAFGFNVSSAGDVNGDGFDDIVVGGLFPYEGFYYDGSYSSAYVIFGHSGGFGTISVNGLNPPAGFRMIGPWGYSGLPMSVSSAGDVNGDGFGDIIVGDGGAFYGAGASYVVFGQASGFGTIRLEELAAGDGFRIGGTDDSYDYAGFSVSGAGDVNGDGFDDLIIGAPYGDNGGLAGEAYVIFGRATGFPDLDLANLPAGAGFVIQGDAAGDQAGFSVSSAGDFNGDGYDDIVVGVPYGNSGNAHSGQAYLIFGRASGFTNLDLTSLAASAGFMIQGDDTGDHAGWSVSAAGDVNGDGYDDIIVGAPGNDTLRGGAQRTIDAGEAYVIFGRASGFGTIDLTNLSSADGFIIQGEFADDLAGYSVSAAGDIDNDGFDDLIIGAPGSDRAGLDAGAAYVLSGRMHFGLDVTNDFNGDGRSDILWRHTNGTIMDWLGQANGTFTNNFAAAAFLNNSWDVIGTGDINGDGREDIVLRNDNGLVMDWLGQANGAFANNYAHAAFLNNDWSFLGIGDFNGDGRGDILWRHANGTFMDWLGQANGSFVNNFGNAGFLNTSWNVLDTGDFNGDGRDDILLRNGNGLVMTWLGQANGGFTNTYSSAAFLDASWQLAGTGDYNGDGRDDILWRQSSGLTMNWLGADNGSFVNNYANASHLNSNWRIIAEGDVNGDGRDDIVWRHDNGLIMDWIGLPSGAFYNNFANAAFLDNSWQLNDSGDYNGDGRLDLLFRNPDGLAMTWLGLFNGSFYSNHANAAWLDGNWQIQPEQLI